MLDIKEIKIGDKKFKIKEMAYLDTVSQGDAETDKREWFKNMLKNSIIEPEPTEEMLNGLTFKEGNGILKEINALNGIGVSVDFTQTPQEEKK